ncbi:MAG: ACP phosphodiesterase [Gammaproteobacteria bacterium]|nr:ACP phosphodiesterase [Gammaproteobacteria bacterium]
MNFLAHAALGRHSESLLVGGFLGEFLRGRIGRLEPAELRAGIWLHRRVDSYTDAHARTLRSRRRFDAPRRRVAGIAVDIIYDHFLAKHWSRFAEPPLGEFAQEAYAMLQRRASHFPPRARRVLGLLVDENWFEAYADRLSLERTLVRVSTRAEWLAPLALTVVDLEREYDELEGDFLAFYPDLDAFTVTLLAQCPATFE